MSGKRRDKQEETFADLVGDAVPLEDRERVHAPSRPPPKPKAKPAPQAESRFRHDTGPGSGRAFGVARRLVAELRQGVHPVDREVDLHGHRRDAAKRALHQGLKAAIAAGERCLLVIHGVGKRSVEGPVLRETLPEWIESPPQAEHVIAYAPAPKALGGAGATLVLLRRQR